MIPVRLLNGSTLYVNADLVETVASAPDTIITLTTGRKIVARTLPEEVLEAVVAYRRRIHVPPGRPAGLPAGQHEVMLPEDMAATS